MIALLLGLSTSRATIRSVSEPYSAVRIEAGGHTGPVTSAVFADEGRVVSAGLDKTVRIWDVGSKSSSVIRYSCGPGFEGIPTSLVSTGHGVVAVGLDGANDTAPADVLTIDTTAGKILKRRSIAKGAILSIAYCPKTSRLATVGQDGAIRLLAEDLHGDFAVIEPTGLPKKEGPALGVSFSPSGDRLAVFFGRNDTSFGDVIVTDLAGKSTKRIPANIGDFTALTWASDRSILCSRREGGLVLWNVETGLAPVILDIREKVISCSLRPGTAVGTAVDETGALWEFDAGSGSPKGKKGPTLGAPAQGVGYSPDGKQSLASLTDGSIALVSEDGSLSGKLKGRSLPVFGIHWCNGGSALSWAVGKDGPDTEAFDLKNLAVAQAKEFKPDSSPNMNPRVEVSNGEKLVIDGKPQAWVKDQSDHIFATGSFGGKAFVSTESGVFAPENKTVAAVLTGHEGWVRAIAVSPNGDLLATGGDDGTIRIWNKDSIATGDAMLTLFMGDDGQWVIWNDKTCFYACSSKGDDYIGVQTNRGPAELADFQPAYACRKIYNRDDVIKGAIDKLDFPMALKTSNVPPDTPSMTQAASGRSEILSIGVSNADKQSDGSWLAHSQVVQVKCKLSNADDRKGVIVSFGVPAKAKEIGVDDVEAGPDEVIKPLFLQNGKHIYSLKPVNKVGEGPVSSLVITFGTVDLARPGNLSAYHVLCVGASKYRDGQIEALEGTEKDATDVSAFYEAQNSTGKLGRIVEPITLVGENATKDKILAALKSLEQPGVVQSNDTVIVYMSGHGFAKDLAGKGHCYFAPIDAKHDDYEGTCIDWQDIIAGLQTIQSPNIILIVDQCHAGAIQNSLEARSVDKQLYSLREQAIEVFASCSSRGVSVDAKKNSVFTGDMLVALRNGANADPDKFITLLRLYIATKDAVVKHAEEVGYLQTPELFGSSTNNLAVLDSIRVAYSKG